MRKKIVAALATGLTFGALFAAPVTVAAAETASGSALNQTAVSANVEQADRLFNEGKFAEAAELYEKAAEATGNNDTLWFKSGDAYYCAGIYDKSVSSCKQAIKLNPNNGLAYNICGIAYYGQLTKPHSLISRTILERAEKYEERAVELLPNSANIRQAAGTIQASLATFVGSTREKHLRKAYQHYCRAVDLAPNDSEKAKLLSNFVQKWSRYGFQPYNPAPQPAPETAGQPTEKTDVTGAANVPSGGTPNVSAGNIPERNANIHPGAVEFRPMGWDEDGFVAIWKNPPGRLGGEYAIRNGNYMNGRHGTDSEGMNFDVIGWDDDGNPNEFLVCSVAGLELGYSCRVKVINHTSVKIDWLETSYQDWKRKRENPASEAPSPILKTASSECPHPIETYSLQSVGTVRMSELERVNENFPCLFVSEYGFYQVNVSYQNWPKTEGYLNHVFYGPMAEALIAFWEAGGEVEDYPADTGNIVYELGN